MPKRNDYWAFPPNAVMPLPIPTPVLQKIKADKGFSNDEQVWGTLAGLVTALTAGLSYLAHSPMPFVAAFVFCAVVVAGMEVDD